MKRANRVLQIEKYKRDVHIRLQSAVSQSSKPVSMIRRHPALTAIVSGVVVGMISRRLLAKPLPPALKLLTIPLLRKTIRFALLGGKRQP